MTEPLLDKDLVAACMTGDVRAFGRLVERHHGAVTSIAFAITRDLALSEDIAQDTFVIAWTRLGELRDPSCVRAWLCNIARNKSKNELRGRKHEVLVDADAAAAQPSIVEQAVAREAESQLRSALAALPDAYREPLVLFYWEGQSIENVASALDITAQAAQKRISRARSYVQDELATRFDEAGRGRRSAKVAAAAIVAVVATRGAPASAAATIAGLGAIKLVAIVAMCLLVGIGVWRYIATRGASASPPTAQASSEPATARQQPPATHASKAPALPASDRPRAAKQSDPKRPKGSFGTPSSYEITALASTRIAVDLGGGKSTATLFQPPAPPAFERRVRGRVFDGSGKPLAGAAVVIDSDLRIWSGTIFGNGGALSDATGAFDIAVHSEAALSAIALHPREGWSALVAVPAGRADATIVIHSKGRGTLSGTVRLGGAPIESEIIVKTSDGLWLDTETDIDGRFMFSLLAPGRYSVEARATQLFAGGTSVGSKRDVVIEAGKSTPISFDLPTGVLVIVTPPDTDTLSTIEYTLVSGNEPKLDAKQLRELARGGKALSTLFGGEDIDQPMQFHDVAPGIYTLCVDRRLSRENPLPLMCKKLTVPADKPTFEVGL